MATTPTVDVAELEARVKDMYRHVAEEPDGDYHFELGRSLAEHLGYPAEVLDRIPDQSIESFAGVGYFFDLAELAGGETVVDLGSGSGMDVFFAATQVGDEGEVVGIDFTESQLEKARRLAEAAGFAQVDLREGRIEDLPLEDASADCVISNGVINLAPDKGKVFAEADARPSLRRPARDRGHRQRGAAEGIDRLQRRAVGRLHRRRRPAGRLPRGDRRRRARDRGDQGEPVPVHLRASRGREHEVRREERLDPGAEAVGAAGLKRCPTADSKSG